MIMLTYELGITIARAFAKTLRPQARPQLPLWSSDDYERLDDTFIWRCDVWVDDDYVFGAHIIVGQRLHPRDAPNGRLQSLFIHRYPHRSTHRDREFIIQWARNEREFFRCDADWYANARRTFIEWYAYVNVHRDKIRSEIDRGYMLQPWQIDVMEHHGRISSEQMRRFAEEFTYSRPITFDPKRITDITTS